MITTQKFLAGNTDAVRRFVKATMEGWKMYLKAIHRAGNKLIQADNPKMSNEQIAYAIKRLNELEVLDGGDAKTQGIGIITEARWKATYDFMVKEGLLSKDVDWQKGFTTQFVKDLKITSR